MNICEKLKKRRKELGLTMLEVAKQIGVSEATVSRWESGDIANMRRDKIVSLANALQVHPSFIMGEEEYYEMNSETLNTTNNSNPFILNSYNKNSILVFGEDAKSPVDDIEPFIASNKEMKMIMEYRTKPEAKNAINQIINKENPTVITNDEALMFALYGEDDKDITPDILEDVRKFAQFIRQKKKEDTI